VLPILGNIQAEVARLATGLAQVKASLAELTERLDKFEHYFVHLLGMTERNTLDIKRLDQEMKEMKERVNRLEPQI
jgi:vacuolar-type H+-ATPase subunit D/Vma8